MNTFKAVKFYFEDLGFEVDDMQMNEPSVGIKVSRPNKVHVIDESSPLWDIVKDMTHEELDEFFKTEEDE